jgi:hypothetical protein
MSYPMTANKLLSADRLFALVRANFEQVTDQRAENAKSSLPDALMSGSDHSPESAQSHSVDVRTDYETGLLNLKLAQLPFGTFAKLTLDHSIHAKLYFYSIQPVLVLPRFVYAPLLPS